MSDNTTMGEAITLGAPTAGRMSKRARERALARLREYRENEPQYPHRLKMTRERIEQSPNVPA